LVKRSTKRNNLKKFQYHYLLKTDANYAKKKKSEIAIGCR